MAQARPSAAGVTVRTPGACARPPSCLHSPSAATPSSGRPLDCRCGDRTTPCPGVPRSRQHRTRRPAAPQSRAAGGVSAKGSHRLGEPERFHRPALCHCKPTALTVQYICHGNTPSFGAGPPLGWRDHYPRAILIPILERPSSTYKIPLPAGFTDWATVAFSSAMTPCPTPNCLAVRMPILPPTARRCNTTRVLKAVSPALRPLIWSLSD